ncbi:protein LATERAL ROOT PRIMORDIUM 1 [Euphorbia lathyris]|uniref:protein LATERAL ROOT PRIMORDIUM 1 n=1 Tax=Euphorbia lathyris TaxID=212925 RepID=UPI003313DDC0
MGMFVVAPAATFNHHHHHHSHQNHHDSSLNLAAAGDPNATALGVGVGVGVGVIPLLTATPCLPAQNMEDQDFLNNSRHKINTGIQFWQNQTQYNNSSHNNNIKKSSVFDQNHTPANLLPTVDGGGIGGGGNSSSSGTATCQDCGNQAKKDCTHRRCRTCCKSRGYHCSTHVKSTWVPAARRRERQLMATAGGGGSGGACSSGSTSGAKKPRLINSQTTTSHTSTSNTTTPRSFDTSSSHHQDAGFKDGLPGQVRAPAVFKCVRVTAVEDGEDEYAYQAVVKIGGHVFKGFLYDQGLDQTRDQCFPNLSELHLGGGANGASTSSPIIDPADVYASASGGLLGGSTYGNPIN